MSWDPEIDDATTRPRPAREGAPADDESVDLGLRDSPPDLLAPIDPDAPVSGHRPPPEPAQPAASSPEYDWSAAARIVRPAIRPATTSGLPIHEVGQDAVAAGGLKGHRQPIVAPGPADLVMVFVLPSPGFDVLVNADHLLDWGIGAEELSQTALANVERWSRDAAWSVEEDERGRRIVSSATGDGCDAARILVRGARDRLRSELGGGRVLVGLPDRDLLVAARLTDDDPEFGRMFATFVADQAAAADDAIDPGVFELVDDRLERFVA